jgi:hypothetical protein
MHPSILKYSNNSCKISAPAGKISALCGCTPGRRRISSNEEFKRL